MRIEYFSYHNKTLDWKVETTFFPNLSLLVGISGVGKTQILEAIWALKNIANGEQLDGVEWNVSFTAINENKYSWSGEYESLSLFDVNPKILKESLSMNGQIIVQRDASEIVLRGYKTPKLSPYESVLSILNQEEDIALAHQSFRHIIRSNFSGPKIHVDSRGLLEFEKMLDDQPKLDQIQESRLDSQLKIAMVYYCVPEVFIQIKEKFIDIFPQVEDIQFYPPQGLFSLMMYDDPPLLEIKEKGVERWIPQNRISSGMYKTFMHISEMFLWPEGTVILIDEFENSLGVNCIDVLTEDLIQDRLQFIITSHHPYIINSINPRYWKIVTRNGGVVTTHDASELEISSSKHQAFIQLINKEEYKEGIGV